MSEIGAGVSRVKVGDRVAVNPSLPCWRCRGCQAGRTNLCRRMTFFGSAAVLPHVQGAFQEQLVAHESQCFVVPASTPFGVSAMAEPLAVCLHAVQRAGALPGAHVLITGSGPIGALTCLAARHAGAASITVTDVADPPLAVATQVGADEAVNVAHASEAIERYQADKGQFDVAFEASGNPQALVTCLDCTRPGGRIVQLGMLPPGEIGLPLTKLTPKELDLLRVTDPIKGKTILAIYELGEDDTYKLCYDPSGKERPKEVKSAPGSGYVLHLWKREKK